jgi:tetratricopeptide (TPR) repeat protein
VTISPQTSEPRGLAQAVPPGSAPQVLSATILATAQAGRPVIQDFCPLAESLEWELGQVYLRERGNKAFISDASPVPFVVNNDGTLSHNAAEVFFSSLVAAEQTGPLPDPIYVLELGIGVGLFARFFLDIFRRLCRQHGKDYYERLCYIAADRSEQMLVDVCRHGVLAGHPGRYRLRVVDALSPREFLEKDCHIQRAGERPLRAVFLNYLLDCLPATVLDFSSEPVRQLCVRTCLGRGVPLHLYTELSVRALAQRAATDDPRAKKDLLEVYGLFSSEYDYRPVDLASVPHGDFAVEFARPQTKRILNNYGAIQSVEQLLGLIDERGFILVNDYGQTEITPLEEFEHQRFSLATFVGVNFPLLKAFFADKHCQWVEPKESTGSIHSRLLGHQLAKETQDCFQERFSKAAAEWRQEPIARARHCVGTGRLELGLGYYRQALDRQPYNWVLLNEIARFLASNLRNPAAGVDMARMALALNPTLSAELWNTLGDCLADMGQLGEARHAFQRALQVNGRDVRARFNLAWTYVRENKIGPALQMIAEGLSLDQAGDHRERFLRLQNEVLEQITQRHRQQDLLLRNLVSTINRSQEPQTPTA